MNLNQSIATEQYQQAQTDHPLFAARLVARMWGHPGYEWFAIADDGEALCYRCVRTEYAKIIRSTARQYQLPHGDGWGIVGYMSTGDTDDGATCAHCERIIAEPFTE